ncbi:hypothetical protein MNV49_003761 [Pseudohyphozyma bogoriensis]|nr:hypothetical protein MNV49_003761 [Pseudohyphozyma bogoriensis]
MLFVNALVALLCVGSAAASGTAPPTRTTSDNRDRALTNGERFRRGLNPGVPANFVKRDGRWVPGLKINRRLRARASAVPAATVVGYLAVYSDDAYQTLLGYVDSNAASSYGGGYALTTQQSRALAVSALVGSQQNLIASNEPHGYPYIGIASGDGSGYMFTSANYGVLTGVQGTLPGDTPELAGSTPNGEEVIYWSGVNAVQDSQAEFADGYGFGCTPNVDGYQSAYGEVNAEAVFYKIVGMDVGDAGGEGGDAGADAPAPP